MTLEEAFYKQKDELHAAQRKVAKLEKELNNTLEVLNKNVASEKKYQEQLSKIQGLNNKLSHQTHLTNRYKELYDKEKDNCKKLNNRVTDLEFENNELKYKLELLQDENSSELLKSHEDSQATINALKDEVARLTARLNANGTNTGTPTSKTGIGQKKVNPNSREKTGKKKGGQPGHDKHEMPHFSEDEITEVISHLLEQCPNCGSFNLKEISIAIKDEYDYEVIVKKIRHKFVEYICLDCGKTVRVPINNLKAANQYGKVIQAMALSLMNVGFVSVNRTRKILTGFSTDPISLCDGYLIKLQKRYSKKLSDFVSNVRNHLLGIPLLYWDDTVVFINTDRACMRFYGNDKIALYTAHLHKDLEGIMDDNILPSLSEATTVMHDHNTINYHDGFIFRNVECLQHLERDLQKISDSSGHKWPLKLKELIKSKIHERKNLIEIGVSRYTRDEIEEFLSKVDSILIEGYKEYMDDLGHYYESDERALLNRMDIFKDNYFAWVKDFNIPTTNNLSERSLRFVKVKDKVSGQFQSVDYARYFADIRTYLETCARNGINEFTALLRLTEDNPYSLEEILSGA